MPKTSMSAQPSRRSVRSWLFAPGDNERILARVFDAGADEILLDLEDGVGPAFKARARQNVAELLSQRPAWVRINKPGTDAAEHDLEVVGALAIGIRVPKTEGRPDVAWVIERLGGSHIPITASIESALGVLNAAVIAASPGVTSLTFGNVDFGADVGVDPNDTDATAYARSALVLASRAAAIGPPSDGVFTQFDDEVGLRHACIAARRLGFWGKAAIHPRQVPIINDVFAPTAAEIKWAHTVVAAYEESGGAATRAGAEMIDLPVYERAVRLLGDE